MIPVDVMQRIFIRFGIFVLLTWMAELLRLKANDREVGAYFGILCSGNCITCSSIFVLNTLSLHPV